MRQARLEIDAIRSGGEATDLWSDEEVLSAVNTSMDEAARFLRLADSNLLTKRIRSTDSAVDLISESYSPSSLRLVSGTTLYTLPPDYVRAVVLLPLGSTFDGVRFLPAVTQAKSTVDLVVIPNDDLTGAEGSDQVFHYYHIGGRTLRFLPTPQDTIDIEMLYHYRPPKLRYTNIGSITRTVGSTTVLGTSTSWLTEGIRVPAELLPNISSLAAVTLDALYATVDAIASDTALTTKKASLVSDAVALSIYYLAMVPTLPEEHHAWLAQYAGAMLLRKISAELSEKYKKSLQEQLVSSIQPEVSIRQMQDSIPVEPFSLPT